VFHRALRNEEVIHMKTSKKRGSAKQREPHVARDTEGVAAGMVVGGAVGAIAGPPGIVAGAIIGGAAGAVAAVALERDADRQATRTRELDAEIGVSGGDLGAPNLKHPRPTVGAYSASSAGVSTSGGEDPAEGPMQTPD
jgi:hypothetical protein